jgi:5-methylcytosine-specific restriction endonuclease McrA
MVVKGQNMGRWTEAEIRILKNVYPENGSKAVAELLDRSPRAIISKAHRLDVGVTTERLSEARSHDTVKNMSKVICKRCGKQFALLARVEDKYEEDGLCGECRGRANYLRNIDKYRKTKKCPGCSKQILESSEFCNGCSQLGERNHNWVEDKGRSNFCQTKEWEIWRSAVLERDNYTCQMCGDKNCCLHGHHILPKRDYPELVYEVDNGITLCKKCHVGINFREYTYVDGFLKILNVKEAKLKKATNK